MTFSNYIISSMKFQMVQSYRENNNVPKNNNSCSYKIVATYMIIVATLDVAAIWFLHQHN